MQRCAMPTETPDFSKLAPEMIATIEHLLRRVVAADKSETALNLAQAASVLLSTKLGETVSTHAARTLPEATRR
jgi:hypothetical protein